MGCRRADELVTISWYIHASIAESALDWIHFNAANPCKQASLINNKKTNMEGRNQSASEWENIWNRYFTKEERKTNKPPCDAF